MMREAREEEDEKKTDLRDDETRLNFSFSSFFLLLLSTRENFIDERRNREEKNLKKKSKEERERERKRADVVRNKRELRARLYPPNFLFI